MIAAEPMRTSRTINCGSLLVASSIAFPLIFIGLFPTSVVSGLPGQVLALLPVSMATHALRGIVSGSALGSFGGDLFGLTIWAAVVQAAPIEVNNPADLAAARSHAEQQ